MAHPTLTVALSSWPAIRARALLDARAQALGDDVRRAAPGVGQQREELLAAEAAELVLGAQPLAQRARDRHERGVAGVMAVLVVEQLEVVDVDHRDRQRPAVAARAADQPGEPREHVAAVEQAGERVLVEHRLEPPALPHELLLQRLGARGRAHAGDHVGRA